jgi:hypothetical protein
MSWRRSAAKRYCKRPETIYNMRKAAIYYKDLLAGLLTETDEGDYVFEYESKYIKNYPRQFILFTMPVITGTFKDRERGLI